MKRSIGTAWYPDRGRVNITTCPLCGRLCRMEDGRLARHYGKEFKAASDELGLCRASSCTSAEAVDLARREAAELDALRLRAHP